MAKFEVMDGWQSKRQGRGDRGHLRSPLVLAVVLVGIASWGCRTPAGVSRVGENRVSRELANLEGAESEYVVRAGHSCQDHPLTIAEVRRILLQHLRGRDLPEERDERETQVQSSGASTE